MAEQCCVYWLYDVNCSVPENDGYVGITNKLQQRLSEHRSKGRFKFDGVEILFVGTRNKCLEKEIGYRPTAGIGWNANSGGTSGKTYSPEVRRKISANQIGRKDSEETLARKRAAHANRSLELRAKFGRLALGNKSRTGQKQSEQERAKRRVKMLGNKYAVGNKNAAGRIMPQEQRDAISLRMRGKRTRLGAKLSPEQRANISAGRTGKGLGNQNWRKRIRRFPTKEKENGATNCGLIGPSIEQSIPNKSG